MLRGLARNSVASSLVHKLVSVKYRCLSIATSILTWWLRSQRKRRSEHPAPSPMPTARLWRSRGHR